MTGQTIALLSVIGSLIAAAGGVIGALITGRATAHKTTAETRGLDAKLPAEVDSVVVQGAEAAVLTMDKALKAAQQQIDDLEAARKRDAEERAAERRQNAEERARDRERMAELQSQVDELRLKVDHAEAALKAAREAGENLTNELKRLAADQDAAESKRAQTEQDPRRKPKS